MCTFPAPFSHALPPCHHLNPPHVIHIPFHDLQRVEAFKKSCFFAACLVVQSQKKTSSRRSRNKQTNKEAKGLPHLLPWTQLPKSHHTMVALQNNTLCPQSLCMAVSTRTKEGLLLLKNRAMEGNIMLVVLVVVQVHRHRHKRHQQQQQQHHTSPERHTGRVTSESLKSNGSMLKQNAL